jgi:hypothetical protein
LGQLSPEGRCSPGCEKGSGSGSLAALARTTTPTLVTAFFFLAGERLRHDRLLRHLGQLEVGLLLFVECLREKLGDLLLAELTDAATSRGRNATEC